MKRDDTMEEREIAYNDLVKLSLEVHYFMAYEILNSLEQAIMKSEVESSIVYDSEVDDGTKYKYSGYWKTVALYTRKMKNPYGKYYRFDCGILEHFIKQNLHNINISIKQMVGNELWFRAWVQSPYFISHDINIPKNKIEFYRKMFTDE